MGKYSDYMEQIGYREWKCIFCGFKSTKSRVGSHIGEKIRGKDEKHKVV